MAKRNSSDANLNGLAFMVRSKAAILRIEVNLFGLRFILLHKPFEPRNDANRELCSVHSWFRFRSVSVPQFQHELTQKQDFVRPSRFQLPSMLGFRALRPTAGRHESSAIFADLPVSYPG